MARLEAMKASRRMCMATFLRCDCGRRARRLRGRRADFEPSGDTAPPASAVCGAAAGGRRQTRTDAVARSVVARLACGRREVRHAILRSHAARAGYARPRDG